MAITLYDLAAAEPDRRFSPFCWRTRMALAHKGLSVETIPWRFTEVERLAFSGQGKVPVIVDQGETVFDSGTIAEYLERRYPDRPALFGDAQAQALTRFVQNWTETVLHTGVVKLVLTDIHKHLAPADQTYFRQSREARFGKPLEAVVGDREAQLPGFRDSLTPLRRTVERQPFVAGQQPAYADYIVFGAFQWARGISDVGLLQADDPVEAWRRRMLDLHGGIGRSTAGYGD